MRMNIYVPDDLKARMEKVREDVNWSNIACRAFEQKLGEIASRKEKKKMVDVIERLRAAKQQLEGDEFKDGFEWGRRWAKNDADVSELKGLGRMYDRRRLEPIHDWKWFFSYSPADYAPYERLYFELAGDGNADRDAARDFWMRGPAGDSWETNIQDEDWLRGFAEGALDIWNAVKNKI